MIGTLCREPPTKKQRIRQTCTNANQTFVSIVWLTFGSLRSRSETLKGNLCAVWTRLYLFELAVRSQLGVHAPLQSVHAAPSRSFYRIRLLLSPALLRIKESLFTFGSLFRPAICLLLHRRIGPEKTKCGGRCGSAGTRELSTRWHFRCISRAGFPSHKVSVI